MPVKRRTAKRRLDPAAEVAIWESVFDSGRDFFDDLKDLGVPLDQYGRPEPAAAEQAWQRLGARYLATRTPNSRREPWALIQFGEPQCQ